MKRMLFLCVLVSTATWSSAYAGEQAIEGDDLHNAVSGKTVYVNTPMGSVPIRYHENGSLSAHTELALLDGEDSTSDRGRWWVAGNKLCIKWQNWMNKEAHCFTMHRVNDKLVRWQRDDGKSGTARLQ